MILLCQYGFSGFMFRLKDDIWYIKKEGMAGTGGRLVLPERS